MTNPVGSALAQYQVSQGALTSPDVLASRATTAKDQKLKDVCDQFEALFVKQMLSAMRQTVHEKEGLLYGGMGQDVFSDMLYDEYAKKMAKTGSLGVSEMVYNQLKNQ